MSNPSAGLTCLPAPGRRGVVSVLLDGTPAARWVAIPGYTSEHGLAYTCQASLADIAGNADVRVIDPRQPLLIRRISACRGKRWRSWTAAATRFGLVAERDQMPLCRAI